MFIYIHENMDNQNYCMSIKQAMLIVNAPKHNSLNSFCNIGYVYVKQHENNNKNQSKIKRERERETETETETETERQTETDRDRDRERENALMPRTV